MEKIRNYSWAEITLSHFTLVIPFNPYTMAKGGFYPHYYKERKSRLREAK
jgi:hypothetical protein